MAVTREQVTDVLKSVIDPVSGKNLMETDIVRALNIEGETVKFVMEIDPANAQKMEAVRLEALQALQKAGIRDVSAVLTGHATKGPPPDLKIGGHPKPQAGPAKVPGVEKVIAIASGKGGVGKSTVSANLAVALVAEGKRVGLLDADVYGPSQPRMLGVSGRPSSPDGKTIIPLRNHGVTLMSMGLMVGEDEAVVWRGPMLMGALQQMLGQVQWGMLDVMLVDLPPGTGDVQLTLSQKADVAGAIVVSTPQDIALLDARKALNMFSKVGTPVLGMIENMSTYVCPKCGNEEHLFGHGGAKAEADRLDLPFLGEVPLDLSIREAADGGTPIVVSNPESPQAQAFRAIARQLIDQGVI